MKLKKRCCVTSAGCRGLGRPIRVEPVSGGQPGAVQGVAALNRPWPATTIPFYEANPIPSLRRAEPSYFGCAHPLSATPESQMTSETSIKLNNYNQIQWVTSPFLGNGFVRHISLYVPGPRSVHKNAQSCTTANQPPAGVPSGSHQPPPRRILSL